MNEDIVDLQERFAHQEMLLEALNKVVAEQGAAIAGLRDEVDRVRRELREMRPSPLDPAPAEEPPPPHY